MEEAATYCCLNYRFSNGSSGADSGPWSETITALNQFAKGLVHSDQEIGLALTKDLESAKHYLWHGNLEKRLSSLKTATSIVPMRRSNTRSETNYSFTSKRRLSISIITLT